MRTATANGGRLLGKERFNQETGIRESDWLGKYWSKWGDAVREGGFEANEMQGACDENEMIEKFIGLMRELHKLPTANEIRLKARNTTGFRWHNTFARLGSKQQLVARIQAYCAGRPGYEDVVALCAEAASGVSAPSEDFGASEEAFGFV